MRFLKTRPITDQTIRYTLISLAFVLCVVDAFGRADFFSASNAALGWLVPSALAAYFLSKIISDRSDD